MANEDFLQAVQQGKQEVVEEMIRRNADLAQAQTESGLSAVLLAAYYGHPELSALLASLKDNLDIFEAATVGNSARVQELLDTNPGLLNGYANDGFFALGLACFFNQAEVAQMLLERGADVHQRSKNPAQVMPIHAAVASQNLEAARMLLEYGADPNARQADEFVPLHGAAQNGQVPMVKLLLQFGADPDLANQKGQTAISFALESGHPEIAELLRSAPANP